MNPEDRTIVGPSVRGAGIQSRRALSTALAWLGQRRRLRRSAGGRQNPNASLDEWHERPPAREPVDLDQCGLIAAYYFTRRPDWIATCTEIISIRSARAAHRQVTFELTLPDAEAAVGTNADEYLYCLPITRVHKGRLLGSLAVTDEHGASRPVLSENEGALLAQTAMTRSVEDSIGSNAPAALEQAIARLVSDDGENARFELDVFADSATRDTPRLADSVHWDALRYWAEQLAENVFLWTFVQGLPGDRRHLTLTAELDTRPVPLMATRPRRRNTIAQYGEHRFIRESYRADRLLFRQTAVNLRRRCFAALGWAPVEIRVPDPYVDNATAYRLEVSVPEGLEVVAINFRGRLVRAPEANSDGFRQRGSSLRFWGKRVAESGPVDVEVRVDRRGFFNLSVVVASVIAGILWGTELCAAQVVSSADMQTAAAVLLVVPALLVGFAVRPAEGALATRLLAGVRTAIFLAGLLAAGAAASFANIRPLSIDRSGVLTWYASGATCIALILAIGWVASTRLITDFGARTLRACRGVGCSPAGHLALSVTALGSLIVLCQAELDHPTAGHHPVGTLAAFVAIGIACAALSQVRYYRDTDAPTALARDVLQVASIAALAAPLASFGQSVAMVDPTLGWHVARDLGGALLVLGVGFRLFGDTLRVRYVRVQTHREASRNGRLRDDIASGLGPVDE
jgi:hypothetical protein